MCLQQRDCFYFMFTVDVPRTKLKGSARAYLDLTRLPPGEITR